jgi:heme/copper-type cytochrome/quinol oxidase subunit 4
VVRFWFANPVFYAASIFSKALSASFVPMSIFFILSTQIPKKQKMILTGIIVIMVIVGSIMVVTSGQINEKPIWHEFWVGFAAFSFQMRFDVIIVLFLVPLVFGLFIKSKSNRYANSISLLITGILFTAPLLTGLTDQTNQPYRFMSMVVFFAVGVGILFSKVNSKV